MRPNIRASVAQRVAGLYEIVGDLATLPAYFEALGRTVPAPTPDEVLSLKFACELVRDSLTAVMQAGGENLGRFEPDYLDDNEQVPDSEMEAAFRRIVEGLGHE